MHPGAVAQDGSGVDVVVAVFGGAQHLAKLFPSLLEHTDLERHRIVAVVDGPQPDGVVSQLESFASAAGAALVRLDQADNRGYVASVNAGMRASQSRDVILLNTDTVVTRGWVEKLQRAAYSAPQVASATPLSNRATICSVPRGNVDNDLPGGFDIDGFAELVERVSVGEYPRLPTGVGMCLYLKRAALLDIGLFDEATFGHGYGEESDWCFRALRAGWDHVADDATFVFHAGRGSFGTRRRQLATRAGRAMRRLHPEYDRTIARFLAEDPLRGARDRILAALDTASRRALSRHANDAATRPSILHVVHGFPPHDHGGAELYAYWLAKYQASERATAVYTRLRDEGAANGDVLESLEAGLRIRRVVNNFDQRDPLARNALYDRALQRDFRAFLGEVRPDLVHVHHLAGHSLALAGVMRDCGLPLVLQLQDWWTVCARANLLDARERLCSGPGLLKCGECLPLTRLGPQRVANAALYGLRGWLGRRLVRRAHARIAGSALVIDSLRRIGILRDADVSLLPYGVPLADQPSGTPRAPSPQALPLRLGFIGSILPHKGLHVAAAACRSLPTQSVELEVWGDSSFAPEYTARVRDLAGSAVVRFRGRFDEEHRRAVLESLDLLLVPSIGMESFGLVAWEAIHAGVPVVCSDRLPLAEAVREGGFGAVYEASSSSELAAILGRVVADPSILASWQAQLPSVKGWSAHAAEIETVYDQVLVAAR
jgi:glycosyltransferase involved in cell wall biosynthesis/GT2 family glycosyltransferase